MQILLIHQDSSDEKEKEENFKHQQNTQQQIIQK